MRKDAVRGAHDLAALEAEHRALDEQVTELGRRPFLSTAEQAELKRLKKLKLAKKDLIADLRERSAH